MNPLSRSTIEKRVASGLKSIMDDFGYTREVDTILYKDGSNYYDFFSSTGLSTNGSHFYKQELVQKRIHIVESVWKDLMPLVNVNDMPNRPTISLSLSRCFPDFKKQPYYDAIFQGIKAESSDSGIAQYLEIARSLITNYLLPATEKYNDIRAVNEVAMKSLSLTGEVQGFLGTFGAPFRRLIIAKLAGDQRFDELFDLQMQNEAEYLKAASEDPALAYFANYPVVFREIYKRLKQVHALEDPILR